MKLNPFSSSLFTCCSVCLQGCSLFICCLVTGLEQVQCLPCVHHVVQHCGPGSPCLQTEEMEIPRSGWGLGTSLFSLIYVTWKIWQFWWRWLESPIFSCHVQPWFISHFKFTPIKWVIFLKMPSTSVQNWISRLELLKTIYLFPSIASMKPLYWNSHWNSHYVVISRAGSEHQELQEPALADSAELQQPETAPPHWHTAAEQSDGAVVPDALPHAHRLLFSHWLQGVVLESVDRDGGGKPGVQWVHCDTPPSGEGDKREGSGLLRNG